MNSFQQVMGALDAALTEKDFKEATRQFHHMPQTVEQFIEQPGGNPQWYLSDCGYSRLVFSLDDGRLFLTSNSTDRVKQRWDACRPQREAAERVIRGEIARIYPEDSERWPIQADEIVDNLLK